MGAAAEFDPILITGASGFVGSCVVRRLLQAGYKVHLFLRSEANMWRLQDLATQVTVHRGDLRDKGGVRAVLEAVAPRAIVHSATFGAYERQSDARRILETNVLGSYNLLECALAVHARAFVNLGSSSEYGYKSEHMSEQDRLEPNSIYAVAKAAQTHLCSFLARNHDTSIVTFRLFSVYGPWEEPTRLLPTAIRCTLIGLPLEMSSPDTARDFVYVDDVVDAIIDFDRLVRLNGEVFNLGTGRQSSLRDVVATVQQVIGRHSEVRWQARPDRSWDTDKWRAETSKARSLLGWSAAHSLAQGIQLMAKWMVERGDYERRS